MDGMISEFMQQPAFADAVARDQAYSTQDDGHASPKSLAEISKDKFKAQSNHFRNSVFPLVC